jgi:hypothetical protein
MHARASGGVTRRRFTAGRILPRGEGLAATGYPVSRPLRLHAEAFDAITIMLRTTRTHRRSGKTFGPELRPLARR